MLKGNKNGSGIHQYISSRSRQPEITNKIAAFLFYYLQEPLETSCHEVTTQLMKAEIACWSCRVPHTTQQEVPHHDPPSPMKSGGFFGCGA